jgi:PAS domain-containing protein
MEITDRAGAEKSQHRSITAARLSGDGGLRGRVDTKFSAPQVPVETAARRTDREQWCRRVLDALPAAIYTTDTAGRITYYNQAAADLPARVVRGQPARCGVATMSRPLLSGEAWLEPLLGD